MAAAIAILFAASMFADHAANPEQLWQDVHHDRNGHLSFGLDLALALKAFDPIGFLQHLARSRVWPPVHGLVLAAVLSLGGIDMRLAIVPSLIGWCGTIVLTFLIAQRLFADRLSGVTAGALAVTFALASPAFRLITADVMLEGLGAALTASCLYIYLRARAEPDQPRWWSLLGLALTLLFFEKYNYWALTATSLAFAMLSEDGRGWWTWGRARWRALNPGALVRGALLDPFVIVAIALLLIIIGLYLSGPTAIDVFGQRVSLYPPENLVTIAWAVLFLRLALLWRAHRATFDDGLGPIGSRLFYWHAVPVLVSFLLPKRLSVFLWYVGPTHHGSGTHYRPLQAAVSQWQAFAEGFHVAPWVAILVLVLAVAAVLALPRMAAGGRAVAILAALSAIVVVLHPQQQWRFQTTWLFALWALAGAGGALTLTAATARLPSLARIGIAAFAVAAIATAESRHAWRDKAYAVAIHPQTGPSDYELAKAYLRQVAGMQKVGFIATFPTTAFFSWTVREHCRCRTKVEQPFLQPHQTRAEYRSLAADWLAQTKSERIVVVDAPGLYAIPAIGMTYDRLSGLVEAIEQSPRFERIATVPVPAFAATVSVWQRRP
ncbi:MAG: glycosyltransferase family 39 protein [Xanthobacteraceae bacterium]